jgi:CubicO group peptidase (beta-lactamase class C family)
MKKIITFLLALVLISCSSDETSTSTIPEEEMYFPPIGSTNWETKTIQSLNWNQSEVQPLLDYLELKNTKSFIILHNGKIVMENYFNGHTATTPWYWASAGKSLTSVLVGIAQQNGFLSIQDTSQKYLGAGFTSMTNAQERKIKILHQMGMTTGLDEGVADKDCYNPTCLKYKAEPGTRWAYHNAPYTILDEVIDAATGLTINEFALANIKSKTGMDGIYFKTPGTFNNIFYSKARSMARFGLLMLNNGSWNNTAVLNDSNYFKEIINSRLRT